MPAFPLDALPSCVRNYVSALAVSYQVPVELPVFAVLGAISTCIARRYVVHVRPDWDEPLNMYYFVALETGERKSPVVKRVVKPLERYELKEEARFKSRLTELNHELKSEDLDSDQKIELEDERDALQQQGPPRLLTNDVTPERLAGLMAEQGGRMAILAAEGGVLDVMAGRYSQGMPNFDVYLSAFSAESIRVDRNAKDKTTGKRETVRVDKPALTMMLCVQPVKLQRLLEMQDGRQVGLLARFNFTQPRSMVGYQDSDPPPVPPVAEAAYTTLIDKLLQLKAPPDDEELPAVRCSREARGLLVDLLKKTTERLKPAGDLRHLQDWANKYPGRVARLAGTLQLVRAHSEDCEDCERGSREISADTMRRAIEIGEWLLANALEIFPASIVTGEEATRTQALLAWVKTRSGAGSFSKRDAHQALKSRPMFEHATMLDEPLILLERLHYIRSRTQDAGRAGRPASPEYEVNPRISQSSEPSQLDGADDQLPLATAA